MFSSAFKSFSSNIQSNYQIAPQPHANVGAWNIFEARHRKTKTQVAVFVCERQNLEVSSTNGFGAKASTTSIRKAQDEVIERLKKEASSLARLRHPSILQLVEPVEEVRGGAFMFATESVIGPLSQALAQKDRESSNKSRERNIAKIQDIELDELEIQKGLLQVAKGLEFLHESAKLVHGNLTPAAIFINSKSDWKISGLGFCGPPDNAEGHQTIPQISLSEALYNDARLPTNVQLDLDYSSPDFVMDANINFSADIFSLGLVLLACYREPHTSPITTHGNQNTYKKIMSNASLAPGPSNNFGCSNRIPRELESTLPRVLARRPAGRMNAAEFQQSQYFDNVLVNTMRFLDGFPAKTPAEKSQFMRGLTRVMPQFPVSVLEKKILSVLLEEVKDKELLALTLQNVFQIIKMIPARREIIATKVLPRLKDVFLSPSKNAERDTSKEAGLVVFLENIQLVSDNSSAQQFKEDALPILHSAMQSNTHSLVDAALHSMTAILPVLDFSTVKHDLFPVIANVFAKTNSLAIKIRGLEALSVLCGATDTRNANDDLGGTKTEEPRKNISTLDKFTMQEKIVPLLKGIKTKEPAVMMAALKVFQQIAIVGDIEFLAAEVMPILWSFALGPLLDLSQFKAYMTIIQSLTEKIQREQIRKLRELASVQRSDARERTPMTSHASQENGTAVEEDFEKLVLGNKTSSKQDPFAGALSDGQRLVPTTSLSWMSSSGSTTPAIQGGSLRPQVQSRSITPDVSVTSFPPLQATTTPGPWSQPLPPINNMQPTQWSQPLQPVRSEISNTTQGWSHTPALQPTSPSTTNMWNQTLLPQSASGTSRLQATNYLNSPQSTTNQPQNLSSTVSPMLSPPPQSPPMNLWSQPTPPSTIAPPPAQAVRSQPQPNLKPGLEKYQSLL